MTEGERSEKKINPRFKLAIELLAKESKKLNRPLSLGEALEYLTTQKDVGPMTRDRVYQIVRRHGVQSVTIGHGTKNDPRYQKMESRLKEAVRVITKKDGAAFKGLVAEFLSLSEKQLEAWIRNKGLVHGDVGILTKHQQTQLLYLSVAQLFQNHGLPFSRALLASILHERVESVTAYLHLHSDLKKALYDMGMMDESKGYTI